MSNECVGLFGKWFGHKYEKYCVKSELPECDIEVACAPHIRYFKNYTYSIRCKRCGDKKE